jgi:TolB-like protein
MLYLFEDCELDTNKRELRKDAQPVDLEPQVFDLIEFLLRMRDRVITRDDLIATVWRGRNVSESTLSSRINAARSAIGDDGATQRLIRTLPRKGFRFVGTVREQEGASPPPPAMPAAARQDDLTFIDGPSIAVLPFTNMSGEAETDYFADGMAEEIITALSFCSGLKVIARNSSFIYKGRAIDIRQVGRELGVGFVLEGSVRRSQERLRITAQLIEARTGTHLWADRFDGDMSDAFELQDRIAESAAAVIEPKLRFAESERVRRTPPQSMAAYDLWLRASSLASEFTEESLASALQHLEKAVEIEPFYALAMATAAHFHAHCFLQGWISDPEETRAEGLRLAWRALDLATDDANVQWLSAFAIWILALDAQRARELFRRSLMANPNSALALTMAGWVEGVNGNPAEGRKLVERSLRLNPRHPYGWLMSTGMALNEIADKRFEEAVIWAEKALVQNRRSSVVLRALAVALVNSGRMDRARQIVQELSALEPHFTVSKWRATVALLDEELVATYTQALRAAGLPE